MLVGSLLTQLFVGVLTINQECGRIPVESLLEPTSPERYSKRIFGGEPPKRHSRPWQVAIQLPDKSLHCTGSLIAPQWVLTAAHCIFNEPTDVYIHAGAHNLNEKAAPLEQFTTADRFYRHPHFSLLPLGIVNNDIGLIKLSKPLEYNDFVQPICLSSAIEEMVVPGAPITVAGWGDTKQQLFINDSVNCEPAENLSPVLLEVTLKIVSNENCSAAMRREIDETMLCAGDGSKDACTGDSGSASVMKGPDGRWFQVGIDSWGIACGDPSKYAVFNRAFTYCDFIEKTIGEQICLPSIR